MAVAPLPYPTLTQSRGLASSSAAPASFTANYTSNVTAGNALVAVVCVAASAAPAVSTPTNWTALSAISASNTSLGIFTFLYPASVQPGAFTAVAFSTLTNVNGIAVLLFEIASAQPLTNWDVLSAVDPPTSNTTPAVAPFIPTVGNVLWIGVLCSITGQTLTASNQPGGATDIGAWTAGPTATSTTGATNVQAQSFTSMPGPTYPTGGRLQARGTLGGALQNAAVCIGIPGLGAGTLAQSGAVDAVTAVGGSYGTGAG